MFGCAVCGRVLPDEAAHSHYEMRSFVRSDSGVLYPTGQGRLAEASHPMPSNTVAVANLATPLSMPVPIPSTLPKPALPKPAKEKSKNKLGAPKGVRTGGVYSTPTTATAHQEELPLSTNSSLDRLNVGTPKEDHQARQSRLNAYDDAIESVLRRVQETQHDDENDVIYDQIASDFTGNENEPFIPPIVAAAGQSSTDRDEREAQIADTIDAVIARSFNDDSDHSLSPPQPPVSSPPPYDDEEDEIIEVHSVSPLKVEVTTDDILILPPPSPLAATPSPPLQTLVERKSMPEEAPPGNVIPRRSKKPKNRQPAIGSSYDEPMKPTSLDISSRLEYGIPESYVRLEEMSDIGKVREITDEEDDVNQPVPMDAAESLMKLAGIGPLPGHPGIAPPLKRLRISYGSGRERMTEDAGDNSNDYGPEMTFSSKSDLALSYHDLDEESRRSAMSELMEQGQRSGRDEHSKNRGRDMAAEVHDVSVASIASEPLYEKPPAGKKGRPRKDVKKRGRAEKTAVPPPTVIS